VRWTNARSWGVVGAAHSGGPPQWRLNPVAKTVPIGLNRSNVKALAEQTATTGSGNVRLIG
jgi:hypothetical protein